MLRNNMSVKKRLLNSFTKRRMFRSMFPIQAEIRWAILQTFGVNGPCTVQQSFDYFKFTVKKMCCRVLSSSLKVFAHLFERSYSFRAAKRKRVVFLISFSKIGCFFA